MNDDNDCEKAISKHVQVLDIKTINRACYILTRNKIVYYAVNKDSLEFLE